MRHHLLLLFSALVFLTTSNILFSGEPPSNAKEILDRVDNLYRGKSAAGKMTMKVVTAHWTREMTLEFWDKGRDHSLIRILSPAKEKGTATLKAGKDIWNFLPKVKRTIKLPSSMMGGSWMGSHFTNDDLVKESRMADDYTFEVSFEGSREGAEVIEIACLPKPDSAVVWGKVMVTVRKADVIPIQMLYFDEDLKLARTMTFSDIKKFGDRLLPAYARMVPSDKPQEYTEMSYQEIRFDVPLDDDLFTIRSLER
jgi:outer membrane lipoprotein-sorting protein